jgi:integrase
VRILREWKLASGDRGGLVFGTGDGKPESLANIYNRCWKPLQLAAGITVDTGTKDAKASRSSRRASTSTLCGTPVRAF